jgi:hypothetical protein
MPVDLPDRQPHAAAFESFPPGKNVLVDAVDERPVQIEQQRRPGLDAAIVPSAMI